MFDDFTVINAEDIHHRVIAPARTQYQALQTHT